VITPLVNAFIRKLSGGQFGFIGRDKTQASVRVWSASQTDGIRIDQTPVTGLVVGDFVRLNRVIATNGDPVTGTFRVATPVVAGVFTVANWPIGMVVSKPSGTLRVDKIAFMAYTDAKVVRAVVKKVGSPLEKYRGRRSKRPV
jgi:hypothetical protein